MKQILQLLICATIFLISCNHQPSKNPDNIKTSEVSDLNDKKTAGKLSLIKAIYINTLESAKKDSSELNDSENTLSLLNGKWIHEKDSSASLSITNNNWIFNYTGYPVNANDIYKINLTDKLPEFVNRTKKTEFIILTNSTDTMYYEILNLNNEVLSLMLFPTGRLHLYYRN